MVRSGKEEEDDDEDDGNADRSENENVNNNNNNNETFSLEAFRRDAQREEEETSDVRTPRRERRRIATRERKTRIRCEIYEPLESRADDANDRGEENLRSSAKRETHEEDGGKGTRARKFLGRGRGRRGRQRVEQEQEEEDGEV